MQDDVIFRYKNGRIIPIKVNKEQTTNEYMNEFIRQRKEKIKDIQLEERAYVDDFYKLKATDKGKTIGYIDYWDKDNHINVSSIFVEKDYRRIGVATKLYKELQQKHPNNKIRFGALTDEGEALLKKIGTLEKDKDGFYWGKIKE